MFKLLKRMRRREILMCLICSALLMGQIYFDLKLPDYMSDLTILIQTPGSSMMLVWQMGLEMLLCTLASAVLCVACGYLSSRTAAGLAFGVREDLFTHISALGQEEMLRFSVPSLITRTTNDVTQIQMVTAMGIQALIKSPVMAVWAVIKILDKSWELSAITAGFVLALCVSVFLIVSSVLPRLRLVQKLTDQINCIAQENLVGMNVVHAFNAETYQQKKFDETNDIMQRTQLKNQRTFAAMQPIMGLGMNGLTLCIFWVGAALLSAIPLADGVDRLTMFSNVVVFSTYATYVVMSFMMLVMIFMILPAAQISAERINQVLETSPNIREGNTEQGTEKGTVEFRNVTFRYPDAADDDLKNISFRVEQGQTLAIIGATGSGKTTLISLIARFYDATAGKVLVDGVNVKDYTFDALYNKLGYVTQQAILFSGTVKENVLFGERAQTDSKEQVRKAIELAQAAEFVEKMEDGEEQYIAQGGRNISGGQKQRLSIARALARNAEILIFDDSFSALDYRTDAALRAGLDEKLREVTKIIVAQRISTIRRADQILVLDEGKIVGHGTHSTLMKECTVYREIAMSQLTEQELREEGSGAE